MTTRKKILIAAVVTAAALASVALWVWFFWTPLGALVRGSGFVGIILNPNKILHDPTRLKDTWTPGQKQIVEVERRLKAWISEDPNRVTETINSDLGQYRRRYAGVLKNGKRLIAIQMYHPIFISRNTWLRQVFWSAGGGDWAWYITYDVQDETFTNFFTNAPK